MTMHGSYEQYGRNDTADLARSLALSSAKLWEELFERLRRLEAGQSELRAVVTDIQSALPGVRDVELAPLEPSDVLAPLLSWETAAVSPPPGGAPGLAATSREVTTDSVSAPTAEIPVLGDPAVRSPMALVDPPAALVDRIPIPAPVFGGSADAFATQAFAGEPGMAHATELEATGTDPVAAVSRSLVPPPPPVSLSVVADPPPPPIGFRVTAFPDATPGVPPPPPPGFVLVHPADAQVLARDAQGPRVAPAPPPGFVAFTQDVAGAAARAQGPAEAVPVHGAITDWGPAGVRVIHAAKAPTPGDPRPGWHATGTDGAGTNSEPPSAPLISPDFFARAGKRRR